MQALQVASVGSIFSIAFLGLLYGELTLLHKKWEKLVRWEGFRPLFFYAIIDAVYTLLWTRND